MKAIEAAALHGVVCRIGKKTKHLFPRLWAMTLDTPERVKYFGLRNVRSCGICRLRAGRSSARTSTLHDPNEIKNLYQVATTEVGTRSNILRRKRARDTLQRHGFDYKKRCRLTDYVRHSGVQINNFGNELFFGLVRYERMHVYFIAYCTYCFELLAQCVPKKNCGIVHSIVTECHQFRDPSTGITHPRLQSVLNMNHLTAERRVRALFYWGHVLGPQADVIVEDCRQPCQAAVANLQASITHCYTGPSGILIESVGCHISSGGNTILQKLGINFSIFGKEKMSAVAGTSPSRSK